MTFASIMTPRWNVAAGLRSDVVKSSEWLGGANPLRLAPTGQPRVRGADTIGDNGRSTQGCVDALVNILSGPLPELPAGSTASVARQMRTLATPAAVAAWRHPGWEGLFAWLTEQKPGADPVVPAIHAVRRANEARQSRSHAASVASYLLKTADASREYRRRSRELPMGLQLAEQDVSQTARSRSLCHEAETILNRAQISVCPEAWKLISEGIDIGVDWWLETAKTSGLTGAELVDAVTGDSSLLSSGRRLRQYFEGPVARPLVALLLGGDQLGSVVYRSAGTRPSLILAALSARKALDAAGPLPEPTPPTLRAWKTTIARIETAVN